MVWSQIQLEAKSEIRLKNQKKKKKRMVGSGARVSIPASTRKMIQNIKEITAGNYSEDEILAMLHECNMDPDETAQRLLLQGLILSLSSLVSYLILLLTLDPP